MNYAGPPSGVIGGAVLPPPRSQSARRWAAASPGAYSKFGRATLAAERHVESTTSRTTHRLTAGLSGRANHVVPADKVSGLAPRPCPLSVRSSIGQSPGLLIRSLQVRVLPGGPINGAAPSGETDAGR